MKIGILGAMIQEVQKIKHNMKNVEIKTIAGREYYSGKLLGIDTVLVFSRWGKVASSSTTTSLINVFGADLIIFTGVAGAVDENLNVGDIVVSEGLYQHDMDARPIFPRHQIPLLDVMIFRPEAKLIEKAHEAAKNFITKIGLPDKILSKFNILNPKVYKGLIASGDQFITNANKHSSLSLEDHRVLAVEMEGAAVAQVCQEYKVPYIVIRTISDKADCSSEMDFQAFITEVASFYSQGIIENVYSLL